MPKLKRLLDLQRLKAEAPKRAAQQLSDAQSLAAARKAAQQDFVNQIVAAVGYVIPLPEKTDLSGVLEAISKLPKEIPEPDPVDLSVVIDKISHAFDLLQKTLLEEAKSTRQSIPKPQKLPEIPSLEPVLQDLQWVKTFLALKPDPVITAPKQQWVFHIERDRQGFITTIRAE